MIWFLFASYQSHTKFCINTYYIRINTKFGTTLVWHMYDPCMTGICKYSYIRIDECALIPGFLVFLVTKVFLISNLYVWTRCLTIKKYDIIWFFILNRFFYAIKHTWIVLLWLYLLPIYLGSIDSYSQTKLGRWKLFSWLNHGC